MKQEKLSKKDCVLIELFKHCQAKQEFVFDNELVKDLCKKIGFGNPFDVTKIDSKEKLPDLLLEQDYALIHLGSGRHFFIKGVNKIYHEFEPIHINIEWLYKKSILNEFNTSESNILSVANNQRILHHFLFDIDLEHIGMDINLVPKTYFPHRTKTSFSYTIGSDIQLRLENIQIEIDLTIEFNGKIGVFEGKNGIPNSFSIYQLYHPFLYYYFAQETPALQGKIKSIESVYVVRSVENGFTQLRLWSYTFTNPLDLTSIQLQKAACYTLIRN